jgi:hypothetical protein
MTVLTSILVVVLLLLGAVAGVLALLVVGIRRDDRNRNLADAPRTHVEATTRRVLGVGTRKNDSGRDEQEGD